MTIFPASIAASEASRAPWPSQGTATITTSADSAASAFTMPRMPSSPPRPCAAAAARSALRDPMMTGLPASANLGPGHAPRHPCRPGCRWTWMRHQARYRTIPAGQTCPRSCQSATGPWHHGYVNVDQVASLRMLLAPTGWLERAAEFADAMRGSARTPGGLLLVGTPEHEPWHFAAHLDDESRLAGLAELAPTLVRWNPPPGAPPHLSVTLARLGDAERGDSLVVVSPQTAPDRLLERVCDARKGGATILALDRGDRRLGIWPTRNSRWRRPRR